MIINEQVITYTCTCRVVHSTAVRRYRLSDARVGWTALYRHPLRFSPRRYLDFRITSPSSLSTSCSSYHCLTHRCLNMILWCYAQHLVIRVSISKRQCHRWLDHSAFEQDVCLWPASHTAADAWPTLVSVKIVQTLTTKHKFGTKQLTKFPPSFLTVISLIAAE